MSNLCRFFCLAFIFFLSVSKFRTDNIINDGSIFLDLFKDLGLINDVYKNKFILSLFFTDTKSKKLLLGNNNINLSNENKIDNRFNIEDKPFRNYLIIWNKNIIIKIYNWVCLLTNSSVELFPRVRQLSCICLLQFLFKKFNHFFQTFIMIINKFNKAFIFVFNGYMPTLQTAKFDIFI